jgi:hypothetical protein
MPKQVIIASSGEVASQEKARVAVRKELGTYAASLGCRVSEHGSVNRRPYPSARGSDEADVTALCALRCVVCIAFGAHSL